MYKNKAQTDIIAAVLIVGISLFVVVGTYYWVFPAVKDITVLNDVKKVEKQMLDIHRAISQASREQSQRSIPLDIPSGTIRVREDSILYKSAVNLPESKTGEESILYGGINDTITIGTEIYRYINCSKESIGKLGEDDSVCLLRRGAIEIELRYLRLRDSITGNVYNLKFKPTQRSNGDKSSRQVVVQWLNRTERNTMSGYKNITTYMILEMY